jgi:hypothetical protein
MAAPAATFLRTRDQWYSFSETDRRVLIYALDLAVERLTGQTETGAQLARDVKARIVAGELAIEAKR